MARNLKPVSIAGIEGDALISEDISYSADIPEYPVEMVTMYQTQLY